MLSAALLRSNRKLVDGLLVHLVPPPLPAFLPLKPLLLLTSYRTATFGLTQRVERMRYLYISIGQDIDSDIGPDIDTNIGPDIAPRALSGQNHGPQRALEYQDEVHPKRNPSSLRLRDY